MSFITNSGFFQFGNAIYGYAQVVKAGPPVSGNVMVLFADGSSIQMTKAEAKEIFGFA